MSNPIDFTSGDNQGERLAKFIADGREPFPDSAGGPETDRLAERVRFHRRKRLLRVLAKLLAREIQAERKVKHDQDRL